MALCRQYVTVAPLALVALFTSAYGRVQKAPARIGRQKVPVTPRAGLTAAHVKPVMHSLSATQGRHWPVMLRGVVVQVFVAGLQLLGPQSVASVATVHWRQVPATQRLAPAMWLQVVSSPTVQVVQRWAPTSQRLAAAVGQSVLASHSTQALPKQAGRPALSAQSVRTSHWTQSLAMQAGRSVAVVQSGRSSQRRQTWSRHAARGAVQSPPTLHGTHSFVSVSHAGPEGWPTQCVSFVHSTQVTPSSSQTGVAEGQREQGPPSPGTQASGTMTASGAHASRPGASEDESGGTEASTDASIPEPAASGQTGLGLSTHETVSRQPDNATMAARPAIERKTWRVVTFGSELMKIPSGDSERGVWHIAAEVGKEPRERRATQEA
ncbi:MAG: hypothetical protein J0L92_23900 [Deltaproteobacteria bacterium]|nr:hypothetical protein [Deltaproteobacteria bacterium]